ncbi:hypothetical protein ES703_33563 [subsurface metagenome]
MAERKKRKKVKGMKAKKAKEARAVEEEAAEVTRTSEMRYLFRLAQGEKVVEKEEPREDVEEAREPATAEIPREEVEEAREPATAEIPREETVPEEGPPLKRSILQECMKVPSFRARVIYYLVKKLR